jgi:chemotaxis methyl-accepting protein methylase/mannose-6-phosphate isomerase-like protein (cupin superfamily)
MSYIHSLPASASFTGKGLHGFTFGPLKQKDLEIYYIEVQKGHDVFMVSKKITRTYYVLAGTGYFTIDNQRYEVGPGILVEVPPGIEYCYSGTMTLIGISKPRWFSGNDTFTRWNPDVVQRDSADLNRRESWGTRLARAKIFGKSPVHLWLRANQVLWERCPESITAIRPVRRYGDFLHMLVRREETRAQALATLFLRNRPELKLISKLAEQKGEGDALKVTVLACSIGAEAYSVAWSIRSARPDLRLSMNAADISSQAVEFARAGVYPQSPTELSNTRVCEGLSAEEIDQIFEPRGEELAVRPYIREGISWHVGDAGERQVVDAFGPQDIVVANNFLCHMSPREAERCLRNLAQLVRPGGCLFVGGIDLDVRTKVAVDLGWEPVQDLLEEIHDGDTYLRRYWPFRYAGLEPLNKERRDWRTRYAAAFRIGSEGPAGPKTSHRKSVDEQPVLQSASAARFDGDRDI